jgi:hypothetical protein
MVGVAQQGQPVDLAGVGGAEQQPPQPLEGAATHRAAGNVGCAAPARGDHGGAGAGADHQGFIEARQVQPTAPDGVHFGDFDQARATHLFGQGAVLSAGDGRLLQGAA